MFNICIAQIGIWISSNALYNSRRNQINIAQITIWQLLFTNQIKSSVGFLMRGENRSTRGKTSHGRVENQQTQSTYDTRCGNRTWATLVEGKCSHHYANPATSFGYLSHLCSIEFQKCWNGQAKAYAWVWQVYREKEVKKCFFFIFQLCYISVVLSQDLVLLWLQQLKHILLICCKLLCNLKVPYITLFLPFSVLCPIIFWVKMYFFLIMICTFFTASCVHRSKKDQCVPEYGVKIFMVCKF